MLLHSIQSQKRSNTSHSYRATCVTHTHTHTHTHIHTQRCSICTYTWRLIHSKKYAQTQSHDMFEYSMYCMWLQHPGSIPYTHSCESPPHMVTSLLLITEPQLTDNDIIWGMINGFLSSCPKGQCQSPHYVTRDLDGRWHYSVRDLTSILPPSRVQADALQDRGIPNDIVTPQGMSIHQNGGNEWHYWC